MRKLNSNIEQYSIEQYSTEDVKNFVHTIIREMTAEGWTPDIVVGLTVGGMIPAIMIGEYLSVPVGAVNIITTCSEGDLSEELFGYVPEESRVNGELFDESIRLKALFVKDINFTGDSIEYFIKDTQAACLPNNPEWENVWGETARFAALVDHSTSSFKNIYYSGVEIYDKRKGIFPWERWWEGN